MEGRSFHQGGRARVRRALYIPAWVAVRYNPDLRKNINAL
ncbi:transposase [Sphingobium herbicidovorans]